MTVTDLRWIDFPSTDLEVRGMVGEPRALLHRLPETCRATLPADTWDGTLMPSGIRVAFRTDSSRLALRMEYLRHGPRATAVDAYVDGVYRNSAGGISVGAKGAETTVDYSIPAKLDSSMGKPAN